jgi:hypothetical protein
MDAEAGPRDRGGAFTLWRSLITRRDKSLGDLLPGFSNIKLLALLIFRCFARLFARSRTSDPLFPQFAVFIDFRGQESRYGAQICDW